MRFTHTKPPSEKMLFSDRDILHLLIPLLIEHGLTICVGLADSIMVAQAGEAAVSGVALVDSITTLIVTMLTAVATGGAVVAGHYLGQKDVKDARHVANQLLSFMIILSTAITVLLYFFRAPLFSLLFGNITQEVYDNATVYYRIVNLSTPLFAAFTTGSALFRTMGKPAPSMRISLLMNAINIAGNAILVCGLHMGAAGVAIPTAFSRLVAAVLILLRLRNPALELSISRDQLKRWDGAMVKRILTLGIPNGIESSLVQLGKIMMICVVTRFGTSAIAANAIGNTMANFGSLPGNAINLGMTAIVAQCVGAGDYKQARYYVRRLMILIYICHIIFNAIIIALTPQIVHAYNLTAAGAAMAAQTIIIHCVFCMIHWGPSWATPTALRAAGDAKYTMTVGVLSMWIVRLIGGYVLAVPCGFGMIGVWYAMLLDWAVRSVFFTHRYCGTKWYSHNLTA